MRVSWTPLVNLRAPLNSILIRSALKIQDSSRRMLIAFTCFFFSFFQCYCSLKSTPLLFSSLQLKCYNGIIYNFSHISNAFSLQLTDFGLSKVGLINSTDDFSGPSLDSGGFFGDDEQKAQPSSKRSQRPKHSVVGTPDYLAPEILLGMGHG